MMKSTDATDAIPQLRAFTGEECDCYPECTANAPEIAEHAWGDVILDDCSVRVVLHDGNIGERETWSAEFPTESAARLIIAGITRSEHCDELLGESIGTC